MVPDGYYYALPLLITALIIGWLAGPPWAIPAIMLAAFFLWFFRDPARVIPDTPGIIVSPADGKVTDISRITTNEGPRLRVSIFLNVFNVHVNRSPIAGTIVDVHYQTGKFVNAMNPSSAEQNEQNTVTVRGENQTLTFKQIAGLLARRIVFTKKIGDTVTRGERVGLIKFGSRVDLLLEDTVHLNVKVGDKVSGGSSVLGSISESRIDKQSAIAPHNQSELLTEGAQ